MAKNFEKEDELSPVGQVSRPADPTGQWLLKDGQSSFKKPSRRPTVAQTGGTFCSSQPASQVACRDSREAAPLRPKKAPVTVDSSARLAICGKPATREPAEGWTSSTGQPADRSETLCPRNRRRAETKRPANRLKQRRASKCLCAFLTAEASRQFVGDWQASLPARESFITRPARLGHSVGRLWYRPVTDSQRPMRLRRERRQLLLMLTQLARRRYPRQSVATKAGQLGQKRRSPFEAANIEQIRTAPGSD